MPTINGEKPKSKLGALQRKLLKLHPGELRDSEATMILNHIRKEPRVCRGVEKFYTFIKERERQRSTK